MGYYNLRIWGWVGGFEKSLGLENMIKIYSMNFLKNRGEFNIYGCIIYLMRYFFFIIKWSVLEFFIV